MTVPAPDPFRELAARVVALQHARLGEEVLVLCRHGAARRAAMRALLAEKAGWLGIEVATLRGAVAARCPGRLDLAVAGEAAPQLPPDHPWAERLSERPLLRARLQEHVATAHRALAFGRGMPQLGPELQALVDRGWALPEDFDGWQALAAIDPRRVLLVGFDGTPLRTTGHGWLELQVHDRFRNEAPTAWPSLDAGPVDAVAAPDVIAEARGAVAWLEQRMAAGATTGLVLVAERATAERFVAAAKRNGLPVADDDPEPLQSHALVAVLRVILPAFVDAGRHVVRAADLHHVLCHPVLSRRAVGQEAKDAIAAIIADDGRPLTAGVSYGRARRVVQRTRRQQATVAEWCASLHAVRMQLDKAALEPAGDDDERVSATERIVARALESRAEALCQAAQRGTLGALADWLKAMGLSPPSDRLGNAVRGALRSMAAVPASEAALERALAGTSDVGELQRGVQVMRYDAYDGRHADALVLLDVHHKGLGAAPSRDPLLDDASLRGLGLGTPEEVVEARIRQAVRARSNAAQALAIVSELDAGGRAVVRPSQLPVRMWGEAEAKALVGGSYGLAAPLAETAQRQAAIAPADLDVDAIASLQADAEWARAGHRFAPGPDAALDEATDLGRHLEHDDARPEAARPWLGTLGAGVAFEHLSASGAKPMTHCLYAGLLRNVLGIRKPDELGEDLDGREVGNLAHAALERLGRSEPETLLRVVEDADAARERLSRRLGEELQAGAETMIGDAAGTNSAGVQRALAGLAKRWTQHLPSYAAVQVADASEVHAQALRAHVEDVEGRRAGTVEQIRELVEGAGIAITKAAGSMRDALTADDLDPIEVPDAAWQALIGKRAWTAVQKKRGEPGLQRAFDIFGELWSELVAAMAEAPTFRAPNGATVAVEATFPRDPHGGATLPLGEVSVRARGSIDSLVRWETDAGPELMIADYKTNRGAIAKSEDDLREKALQTLLEPQLPYYGLAIRAGIVRVAAEDEGLPVRRMRYDMLRIPKKSVETAIDDADLDHAAERLGALVRRTQQGDAALRPHPEGCPHLVARGVYCDYQDVCRFRALPGVLPGSDEDDGGEA